MRFLKVLGAIMAVGVASVLAVQLFYKMFYRRWQYFTLYDEEEFPE